MSIYQTDVSTMSKSENCHNQNLVDNTNRDKGQVNEILFKLHDCEYQNCGRFYSSALRNKKKHIKKQSATCQQSLNSLFTFSLPPISHLCILPQPTTIIHIYMKKHSVYMANLYIIYNSSIIFDSKELSKIQLHFKVPEIFISSKCSPSCAQHLQIHQLLSDCKKLFKIFIFFNSFGR